MKFIDPPRETRGPTGRARAIDAEVAELKKQPGKWALVRSEVYAPVASAYQKRGCETTARQNGYENAKKVDLYARWPEQASS